MIDEKKLIEEIEKLKSNLIHGACSSQVAMETRCKEEAYNEVLAMLDTMQEEPVSEDLEDAASYFARKDSIGISNPADFYYTVADKARIFKAGAEWQKQKDEHLIWQISSANYEKGKQEAREEMMKDAFTGTVWLNEEKRPYVPVFVGLKGKNPGDKVKLIIIKED